MHPPKITPVKEKQEELEPSVIKKAHLYDENINLPFSTITELAFLPQNVQDEILKISEESNLYYLKRNNDSVFLITSSGMDEKISRHDINFIELDFIGQKKVIPLNNNVQEEDDNGGEWQYDEETGLPIKHIKYNSKGKVEYSETWNYSLDEPIKYEMKDAKGKTLSVKKETTENESDIRSEHLIYDEKGNIKVNISANYEGPEITRFTYFDADNLDDSITIMSEYKDGLKIKENVYSSDYKLKNTYNAEYKDGERVNIKVLDKTEHEVEEIVSDKLEE